MDAPAACSKTAQIRYTYLELPRTEIQARVLEVPWADEASNEASSVICSIGVGRPGRANEISLPYSRVQQYGMA